MAEMDHDPVAVYVPRSEVRWSVRAFVEALVSGLLGRDPDQSLCSLLE